VCGGEATPSATSRSRTRSKEKRQRRAAAPKETTAQRSLRRGEGSPSAITDGTAGALRGKKLRAERRWRQDRGSRPVLSSGWQDWRRTKTRQTRGGEIFDADSRARRSKWRRKQRRRRGSRA